MSVQVPVRSAPALRRLYDRYRHASAASLVVTKRKPGEWLRVAPGSSDGADLAAALGVDLQDHEATDDALRAISGRDLAWFLSVTYALDVRLSWWRSKRSASVNLKFWVCPPDSRSTGREASRHELPEPVERAMTLQLDDTATQAGISSENGIPVVCRPGYGVPLSDEWPVTEGEVVPLPDDEPVSMTLPDGSPLPDLSDMLDGWEIAQRTDLVDGDSLDALFPSVPVDFDAVIADAEVEVALRQIRANAEAIAASPLPKREQLIAPWKTIAERVVGETVDYARHFRATSAKQQLVVLAPSPGTGKTVGMTQVARDEQLHRRRVGYAVKDRESIPEAVARLQDGDRGVRLIVIEGRHEGNCVAMPEVAAATNAGYSPATTVCPSCEKYPRTERSASYACAYYRSRIDAYRAHRLARFGQVPPIIVTTHASAVQGSMIIDKRWQEFWRFDSLLIDEDPTDAFVETAQIAETALTFWKLDEKGQPTASSLGTTVLREAMQLARVERNECASRQWCAPHSDEPSPVHTREYGSAYAGVELHRLLDAVARKHGHSAETIAAAVVNDYAEQPMKGEVMSMDAVALAEKYPVRTLAHVYAALRAEMTSVLEARAAGMAIEPAYQVHLDLVLDDRDEVHGVVTVRRIRTYAVADTNIWIGDAYADVNHYRRLLPGRELHLVDHRAVWPVDATLVRMICHAGVSEIDNQAKFRLHLDTKLRPVLELEAGRSVLFYVHKVLRDELREWLDANDFGLDRYHIEHWGSGRGKDIYRDVDTFVAVTEYVPSLSGMLHEANFLASVASESNTRIEHWSATARQQRRGPTSFAASLADAHPIYAATVARKATDELAQAVHRIRPAIPSERPKRAYVLGHRIPWTQELLAATCATAIIAEENDVVVEVEQASVGRGSRIELASGLVCLSAAEVALIVEDSFQLYGCWSNAFAHMLVSCQSWRDISVAQSAHQSDALLLQLHVLGATPRNLAQVLAPPSNWHELSERVRHSSRTYARGVELAVQHLSAAAPLGSGTAPHPDHRGGRGYQYWGSGERFEKILRAHYTHTAERVPF